MSSEGSLVELCPVCLQPEDDETVAFTCCQRCHATLTAHGGARIRRSDILPLGNRDLEAQAVRIARGAIQTGDELLAEPQSAPARRYYRSMSAWVAMMAELRSLGIRPSGEIGLPRLARLATYISLLLNTLLLTGKLVALSSGVSYTVIATFVDSALDLIAGTVLAVAACKSGFSRDDVDGFPVGKTRFAPLGVLVFSVLMACASLYVCLQSVMGLVRQDVLEVRLVNAVIIGSVVVVKLVMFLVYRRLRSPVTDSLADDHRNDVITNAIGLCTYYLTRFWWPLDGLGGIVLSLVVSVNWGRTAYENVKMFMGAKAPDEVVRAVTFLAINHHPLIVGVEQVIAFQVGPSYFVEVHVILPGRISLEVAHWVGESLQLRIECLGDIERAWVHLDCEEHNPNEHIFTMRATGALPEDASSQGA